MPGTSRLNAPLLALLLAGLGAPASRADQALEDGLRLFEAGSLADARERFSVSTDPRAPALAAIADASMGRCAEASPHLAEAAELGDPSTARLAGLAAARCLIAGEQFDAAMGVMAGLRERHPAIPDILYETARLHLKGWNEAVAAMFGSAPASFRVNQLSAEIFEIQDRYDDAVREYRKAIEKAPGTINLHYRLGRALLIRSHETSALEEALEEFRAELRINPNDAVAEFQVARSCRFRVGEPKHWRTSSEPSNWTESFQKRCLRSPRSKPGSSSSTPRSSCSSARSSSIRNASQPTTA